MCLPPRPAAQRSPTRSSIPASVPLKYLGISATPAGTEVVEYPDSGKFGVASRYDRETGKSGLRYIGRAETSIDYWDGE